ncbi:hypothetical protein BDR06DRAFT_971903 [Suillus hirtellus]|nr:hypothetical protein BDR06DRAFT_971903 [Suillus hirtellus]
MTSSKYFFFLPSPLFGTLWYFAKAQTVLNLPEVPLDILLPNVFQVEKQMLEVEAEEDRSGSEGNSLLSKKAFYRNKVSIGYSAGQGKSQRKLSSFLRRTRLQALDIFATYLTSWPVTPLNKEYIKIKSLLCIRLMTLLSLTRMNTYKLESAKGNTCSDDLDVHPALDKINHYKA